MKIRKGDYGYRNSNKRMRMAITGVLILAILIQLAARLFTDSQAAKNILTVMAVLTVLPMANMASPLLAGFRYRTPSEEFHSRLKPREKDFRILYDLILTTKSHVIPVDAAVVHPNGVYCFCTAQKLNLQKAEKELNTLFSDNHLDPNVKLITDEKSFFRRLDSLKPASECADEGTVDYGAQLLKNLSM
ncbi:MAG: O-linked GlcNAc transferase-like protein [Eubacteriales bacterium]|nr:O-linked GlcNAc transferase-like protein [Eubacteriales bacterium]